MATQVSLTDGAVASAGALAIQTNGTTQAVSISTGQVATLAQNPILTSGTANGVVYLNGSKAATSGSAVTYNGTTFATTADATISGLTVGKGAGAVSTNTAVGASALATNSTGVSCTAVGYQALQLSTVDGNTAIGRIALQATSTGAQNTAVGSGAAPLNTTGTGLVAIGANALGANTTGSSNVGVGRDSLASNTTGSGSTALGYQAGYSNTTSSANTFIGYTAGYSTTGALNTFVGAGTGTYGAGFFVTTGSKNTILGGYNGNQGGLDIRTASNYIVLSDGDGNPRAYCNNNGAWIFNSTTATIYCVGTYNATTASGANTVVLSDGSFARSTSALKYKQDVRDLEELDINLLRPVRYKSKCESDDQTKDHLGLIADEAAEAGFEELVTRGADGEIEGFQYERLTVVLLKKLQVLEAEVKALKGQS